ncbi:hypothetical protein VCHA53O466_50218 [Vibrio chagasii]|nr:hypothetical protein VCHA53O466_50218 [Vibrio chagasii]
MSFQLSPLSPTPSDLSQGGWLFAKPRSYVDSMTNETIKSTATIKAKKKK